MLSGGVEVWVAYRVDHEHALHDVPEGGAEGVRQGVIHPLHYRLEQPRLILGPEGQLALQQTPRPGGTPPQKEIGNMMLSGSQKGSLYQRSSPHHEHAQFEPQVPQASVPHHALGRIYADMQKCPTLPPRFHLAPFQACPVSDLRHPWTM